MKRWWLVLVIPLLALTWAGCGDNEDLKQRVGALEETVKDLDAWALEEYKYQEELRTKLLQLYVPDDPAATGLEPELIRRLRADLIEICKLMMDTEIKDIECETTYFKGDGDTTPPPDTKKYPPDD